MPTYEYECTNCGAVMEIFQSITAKPKKKPDEPCEGCGERAPIKRLISSGGAVIFKGGGFYETDYRSESYKKAAEAEKKSAEGKSDSKADSKSETKSETTSKPQSKPESKPKTEPGKSAKKK